MSQTSTIQFALSVFNLLFAAAGALLVYFDWNAARRREYLYLYFTEEKPSYDYFAAARRRRTQYMRLMVAFSVLFIRQFLALVLSAHVVGPDHWDNWLQWLQHNQVSPAIVAPRAIYPWLGLLEILGLAWLGFALLQDAPLESPNEKSLGPALMVTAFAAIWAIFVLCFVTGLLGDEPYALISDVTDSARFVILAMFVVALIRREDGKAAPGLLIFTSSTLTAAFSVWLVAATLGDIEHNPVLHSIGLLVGYGLIVGSIVRGALNDYEGMELSRHRLGRERGVIFTFLKRLGAAFTTDVEVDQILKIILESALETTEASAGAIYLSNTVTKTLEPRVVLNFFPPLYVDAPYSTSDRRTEELEEEMKAQSFAVGEGVIGEVAKIGQSQLIPDVRASKIMLGTTTEYMRNRSMLVVPLRVRDETLGVMAVLNKQRGSFGPDDNSLLQALADQASLSVNNAMLTVEVAKQERLRRDLQIARDIQQRLLPDHCPIIPGFAIAARGTSALEVGGDYYDFFWVDSDKLGIVVADVSGKGVYAALVVAMIRSAFRTQAPGNPDVRDVLSRVNAFIADDLRRDMFVTCVYGILEVSTKKFSWARAGHEPLVVAHTEQPIDVLSPDGFALGVIGSPDFSDLLEVKTIELHVGDRLLMFTDGLTEAMNAAGEEFGLDRILQSMGEPNGEGVTRSWSSTKLPVSDPGHEDDPEEMKHLEEMVSNHVGDAPQSDDLTIVYLAAV